MGSSGMQRLQRLQKCPEGYYLRVSSPGLRHRFGTANQLSLTFTTCRATALNAGSVCKAHANCLVHRRMIRPASQDGEECLRNIGIEPLLTGTTAVDTAG